MARRAAMKRKAHPRRAPKSRNSVEKTHMHAHREREREIRQFRDFVLSFNIRPVSSLFSSFSSLFSNNTHHPLLHSLCRRRWRLQRLKRAWVQCDTHRAMQRRRPFGVIHIHIQEPKRVVGHRRIGGDDSMPAGPADMELHLRAPQHSTR